MRDTPQDADPAARVRWRAALLLGLITSTYSTLIVSWGGARIGRDVAVDWMIVASLVMRDHALRAEPSDLAIAVGIVVHQFADLAWALVFFGLLGRWTARWRSAALLAAVVPWAALTSAIEWAVIVPLLPFRQPVFTLEQVYWLGFTVHLVSGLLYPLFPWLLDQQAGRAPSPHRRFATVWGSLAGAGLLAFGSAAALGLAGRELPHAGGNPAWDRDYMRRMAVHHAQGVEIATLAAGQAADPHLRALARLMVAVQRGENEVFAQWWQAWFKEPAAFVCSEQERAAMPGMLNAERISQLRSAQGKAFDAAFVDAMSEHHRGAIAMAEQALRQASDPRLRLMSHAIRHEQRGEIGLIRGAQGLSSVALAVRAMLEPAGRHPADQPGGLPREQGGQRQAAGRE